MKISTAIKTRVLLPIMKKLLSFAPIEDRRGWWRILESYTGAWQQDVRIDAAAVDAYWANFACLTLICSDVSKMPPTVMQYDTKTKIWVKTNKRAPVLRKPNHYQTTIEFLFSWVMSELRTGNTYVLKVRDPETGFVKSLYVLDPNRVTPYVTSDGGVYYRLEVDELSLIAEKAVLVPASEIIHDRMYPLYHPLCGLPPVFACGIIAMQGHAIVNTSTMFFGNRGMPAGILTAPGHIPDDTAQRLKEYFDANFTGQNAGKVAVLGDALKFESLGGKASDAQLIEQLKMTGEIICACYHVPGYKIGVGPIPSVNNTAILNQQYYDQCLQYIIEKMESRLDEGLELREDEQVWLDIGALLRMDPQTKSTVLGQRVKDSLISTNEARREDDLEPVPGGDSPMIQQQNYSLAALALRDEREKPKTIPDGQITTIQALVTSVANGEIPLETAKALAKTAYPTLTDTQLNDIFKPLENFEPEPTEPAAPSEPATEEEGSEEDEEVEEDDAEKQATALKLSSMETQLSSMKELMERIATASEKPVEDPDEFDTTEEDFEYARNFNPQLPSKESSEVIE